MSAAITNLITSLSLNPQKTHLPKPTRVSLNPPTKTKTTTVTLQQNNNNNKIGVIIQNPTRICLSKTTTTEYYYVWGAKNINIMYFKAGCNMVLRVEERWTEKELIDLFNKKTNIFGIRKECYRRRFFENPRDKAIRKLRDSIRRRKKRPPNRDDKSEGKKRVEEDEDNWELPDEELPEHDYLSSISQTNNRWDNDERGRTSNIQSNDSWGAFENKKKGKWNK